MTNYFIIEVQIVKGEKFSTIDFDKKAFEKDNNVSLKGQPVSVNVQEHKVVLVFEADKKQKVVFADAKY